MSRRFTCKIFLSYSARSLTREPNKNEHAVAVLDSNDDRMFVERASARRAESLDAIHSFSSGRENAEKMDDDDGSIGFLFPVRLDASSWRVVVVEWVKRRPAEIEKTSSFSLLQIEIQNGAQSGIFKKKFLNMLLDEWICATICCVQHDSDRVVISANLFNKNQRF